MYFFYITIRTKFQKIIFKNINFEIKLKLMVDSCIGHNINNNIKHTFTKIVSLQNYLHQTQIFEIEYNMNSLYSYIMGI